MRLPAPLAGLLYFLASQAQYAAAGPIVWNDELQNDWDWVKHLFDRQNQCAGSYCGASSQYCCTGGLTCYTDAANIARCGGPTAAAAAGGSGVWQYSTTTIVMTDLVTVISTYSSFVPAATVTQNLAQSTAFCNSNQIGCGALCCESDTEICIQMGKCTSIGYMSTASPSAPLRPTSGTITTTFITTTQSFETVVGTGGLTSNGTLITPVPSSGGLSGGAIAGIVIGVLAGVIILLAICFCCVLRAGVDGLLGLFGLRNNRSRERTEVIEERYSHHGSAASRRDTQGARTTIREKKSSGLGEGGILAAIALGLAGLWAILGLSRKSKAKTVRSEVSYESYTDSYTGTGTSESESSFNHKLEQKT